MHHCLGSHATNMASAPAENLVQLGIGGWQVPREGVKVSVSRGTNVLTVHDICTWAWRRAAKFVIERATTAPTAVYIFDYRLHRRLVFVPGTGWPEPGRPAAREALSCWS